MIAGERALGLIPARGGSKGIPGKNTIDLAGKPLIAWTIEAARTSRYLDRVVLTSDSEDIQRVAREHGCEVPFTRPAELATDEAPGIAPVLHALDTLDEEFGWVVLLQPTSPLRVTADIDAAIELCLARDATACVSVTPTPHSPYWTFVLDAGGRMQPVVDVTAARRQDLPRTVMLNGAVYVARVPALRAAKTFLQPSTVAYNMPYERSVDIDTPLDLRVAALLLEERV